jgi:tetratricopeptide (TPR) repeat protein
MRTFFLLIGLFAGLSLTPVKADFVFSERIGAGISSAIALNMGQARQLLEEEKKLAPSNSLVVLLENYIDFYTLVLDQHNPSFESAEKKLELRLERLEKDPQPSPWKGYALAEVQLHWTILHAARQNYLSAVRLLNRAKNNTAENSKRYPNFELNYKIKGLLDVAFGSVPESYRWLAEMAGFSGDQQRGLQTYASLQKHLHQQPVKSFAVEIRLSLAFLQMHVNDDKHKAWSLVANPANEPDKNLLTCYFMGFLGRQVGENDRGIAALSNRPRTAGYLNLAYFDYQLGTLLVYNNDDQAVSLLNNYIRQEKVQTLKKDAALRLYWLYSMRKQSDKQAYYRKQVLSIGNDKHERDKLAIKEVSQAAVHYELLVARIRHDGGYFEAALAQLADLDVARLSTPQQLEYHYRKGRLLHDMNQADQALIPLTECVKLGKNDGNYLPANACLLLAKRYEERADKVRAKFYYERCLSYDKHPYTTSMHTRARAGLKRLGS